MAVLAKNKVADAKSCVTNAAATVESPGKKVTEQGTVMGIKLTHFPAQAILLAVSSVFAGDNLDYGTPGPCDQLLDRTGFALGYSVAWKQPKWVCYRLTAEEVTTVTVGRSNDFQPDPDVRGNQAQLEDYRGSGYDRGHNAPSADMKWSAAAMRECFYLSNMSPQDGACNSGIWNEIENTVRGFACREGSVFVLTGPYVESRMPKTIGRTCRVVVPDGFWKVIYDETPPCKMIGFLVPNRKCFGKPSAYACSVSDVERKTGLRFFSKLSGCGLLKTTFDTSAWDWSKSQKVYGRKGSAPTSTRQTIGFVAERKEYFAGRNPEVGARPACPVTDEWPDTGYWLSTNSNARHNRRCPNYRKTRGYPCQKDEGRPCGKCGG